MRTRVNIWSGLAMFFNRLRGMRPGGGSPYGAEHAHLDRLATPARVAEQRMHTLFYFLLVVTVLAAVAWHFTPRPPEGLAPAIVTPVVFADGPLSGAVDAAAINAMGGRTLFISEGRSNEFVLKGEDLVKTPTLAAYGEAMAGGGIIHGRYAAGMAGDFVRGLATWQFMLKARPSLRSPFSKDWFRQLPAKDAVKYGWESEGEGLLDKTLSEAEEAVEIIDLVAGERTMTYSGRLRDHEVTWLASGDIDSDGIEDRLLLLHAWASEGSGVSCEALVASMPDPSSPTITLRPFPEGTRFWH